MDFTISDDLQQLVAKTRSFVRDRVIPFETDPRWTDHGPTDALRIELNDAARAAGVFAPHVALQFGGQALSNVGKALVFEAAGYSILGPVALHCAAPDEGNMHLLQEVATPEQQRRWLRPLAIGKIRSCFCMTEPAPGAGADPTQLQTTAKPDGDGYLVNGSKYLITGADGAGFAIIMARLEESGGGKDGATMFLAEMTSPGIHIERRLDTLDSSFTGGHAVVRFDNLHVSKANVLGALGQGYDYAQVRLAPARLTHCMRWLGSAVRAHEIAARNAATRTAFGRRIGDHGTIGAMLADNAIDIHSARLAIWHTAWLLDRGNAARTESAMVKVQCSEAIYRVADRCLQIMGGRGTTRDTVIERIFREVRSFRIYDGPSEVHRWSIGRRILREQAA